ncbi:MAG: hypothetical protein ACXU99_00235 [Thermodesulfobacteriota bacterium]
MPHISLSNLTISYGNQKVLQNITVDIPNNEITTIIGPSAAERQPFSKASIVWSTFTRRFMFKGKFELMGPTSTIRKRMFLP